MRKIAAILSCLMFVMMFAASCGKSVDSYIPGVNTETGYSSEWLGFEFIPSENMVMATSKEIEAMLDLSAEMFYVDEATGEQVLDKAKLTTVYEMMATDIVTGGNIIVMVEKLSLANTTVEQYVEALKSQIDSQLEVGAKYSELSETTIAGQNYTRFEYTMKFYGIEVGQVMFIRKIDGRMATICMTADEQEIDAFLSCFKAK